MTQPPTLYPRKRFTALVVTMTAIAITLAGLVVVVVLQGRTISAADAHRTRDLKRVDQQLDRATAEIQRLQELVRALGGNPGTFTLNPRDSGSTPSPAASASHSAYVAPQPSPAPRPSASRHPSPRPSRTPPPSPSPSRSPSPSPTCILPSLPRVPCFTTAGYVARVAGPQVVGGGSRLRDRWPRRARLD